MRQLHIPPKHQNHLRRRRHNRRSILILAGLTLLAPILFRCNRRTHRHALSFASNNTLPPSVASNLIVSEQNRLIFCPVPKAANTNWKYLLRKWENLPNYADLRTAHNPELSGLRYLSDYSPIEAATLLSDPTYFRFVFVRDPYTRLLSCYMDKFRNEDPIYVHREYRLFLAQLFSWREARAADIDTDPRPSFRAFVDELVKHAPVEMNAHWRPQTVLCGFGLVRYDFVGRMENLKEDVRHVFKRLGKPDEQFPTQRQLGFPPSGASSLLADGLYTLDLMYKVRVVYEDDFRLLGYV